MASVINLLTQSYPILENVFCTWGTERNCLSLVCSHRNRYRLYLRQIGCELGRLKVFLLIKTNKQTKQHKQYNLWNRVVQFLNGAITHYNLLSRSQFSWPPGILLGGWEQSQVPVQDSNHFERRNKVAMMCCIWGKRRWARWFFWKHRNTGFPFDFLMKTIVLRAESIWFILTLA